jgi:MYXO-CTERM domain-containing protein
VAGDSGRDGPGEPALPGGGDSGGLCAVGAAGTGSPGGTAAGALLSLIAAALFRRRLHGRAGR